MALFQSGPATRDLRGFLKLLEERGQLRRITAPVDPDLELAAIADRVLSQGGPALLFENVIGSSMPVAVNTLGTVERVVWSMGLERAEQLEELGSRLALLQQPRPPKGWRRPNNSHGFSGTWSRPSPTATSHPPAGSRCFAAMRLISTTSP